MKWINLVINYCSIIILDMTTPNANGESSGVNRNLEEEAHYLETEYNNTLSGNYKLVQDYGSTSDVDKGFVKVAYIVQG